MNELQIFNNEEFGDIRVLNIENESWFVGKDIADILGYERTDNAIRTHVDEEDKLMHQISASGQNRNMTIINESGLYSLILSSKLPNAKKFKRWVTSEVLPSIRKTGAYFNQNAGNQSDITQRTLIQILNTQNKILDLMSRSLLDKNQSYNVKTDDISALIQEQSNTWEQSSKVLSLPPELLQTVNKLLLQKDRNFSYISRFLFDKGYQVSNVSISRYYDNYLCDK